MNIKSKLYYFFVFSTAFVFFTPIGTLSHEYGHIIAAKILGYNSILHYGSMDIIGNEKSAFDSFMITLGGPLQTVLTGTIGFIGLILVKKKESKYYFPVYYWGLIFISLFWLRQVFIVVVSVIKQIVKPNGFYFGGDEGEISRVLNLPNGTISIVLSILGMMIATYVIFRIVPKKIRYIFIESALVGGVFGFILWMYIIGPKVLP